MSGLLSKIFGNHSNVTRVKTHSCSGGRVEFVESEVIVGYDSQSSKQSAAKTAEEIIQAGLQSGALLVAVKFKNKSKKGGGDE